MSIYGTSEISGSGNFTYDKTINASPTTYPNPDLYQYICLSQDVSNSTMYNYAKSTWDLALWGPVSSGVPSASAGYIGTSYSAYTTPTNIVITTDVSFTYGCMYFYTNPADSSTTNVVSGTTFYNGCVAYSNNSITLPSLKTGFTFSGWWKNTGMINGHDPATIFALVSGFGAQESGGNNYIQVALYPSSQPYIYITYGLLSVSSSTLAVNISSAVSNAADGLWHFIGVKFYGTSIDLLIDNTWFRNTPSGNNALVPQNKTMNFTCGFNYGNWRNCYSWIYVSNLNGWSQALSDTYLSQVYTNYALVYNTIPIVTTFAGIYNSSGYSGNNGLATSALLNRPTNMAYDPSGYLYFTEYANHVIRMINMQTNIITTILGNGTSSTNGGNGGLAVNAQCTNPFGIVIDEYKNIFFTDNFTNVRKIDAVTKIVSAARTISASYAMCIDNNGNLLIAGAASTFVRYKKDSNGLISSTTLSTTYSTTPISDNNTLIYGDPNGNIWCGRSASTNTRIAKYSPNGEFIIQLSQTGPFASAYGTTALKPYPGAVFIRSDGAMIYASYSNSDASGQIYKNLPGTDGNYGFGTKSSAVNFTTRLSVGSNGLGYPNIVNRMGGNYQIVLSLSGDAYITQDNGHCITKIKNFNLL